MSLEELHNRGIFVEVKEDEIMGDFLEAMNHEHPELVSEIRNNRIPNFFANLAVLLNEIQNNTDEISPRDPNRAALIKSIIEQDAPDTEFIQMVKDGLRKLKYVSSREVQQVMEGYAKEVQEILESDPSKIVIFDTEHDGDSSESYLAEMVRGFVKEDLRNRVKFYWDDNVWNNPFTDQSTITFYRFDDSANSGAQIISSAHMAVKRYKQPVDIRIRLVACSRDDMEDKVSTRVAEWLVEEGSSKTQYAISVQYKYLNDRIELSYKGAVISWGTSIVFGHKIQDNLPEIFLRLNDEHRKGMPYIFKYDKDIRPPYRK